MSELCLIIAPNWVGDTVMALPTLEALAAGGRRLAVLARPHLGPLLGLAPPVDEVIRRADDDRRTIAELRRRSFPEAVVLPNSFRSAWLPHRAAIPRRWGYRGNFRGPLLRPALARPRRPRRHQTEDFTELLAAMGVDPPADWRPRLPRSEQLRERGAALLARARLEADGEGPLVGLFPGAEFGPSKRWPWQRFAELARQLRRRLPAARLLILAGPKEVWLAVRAHEETAKLHPVVGPDLDLADLASVLARLDLLVSNDSGPMHLAAALGVPCVALFGPTDPRRTAPGAAASGEHRVLYTGRWCSPCFRRRCPLLHHRCLRDVAPADALAACLGALDRG